MLEKEVPVLFNLGSNRGYSVFELKKLLKLLNSNNINYTLYSSARDGSDLEQKVQEVLDKYDYIIIGGGDGTTTLFAQKVIESGYSNKKFAIAIAGDTNDIAKGLGFKTLKDCLAIQDGKGVNADVGCIECDGKKYYFFGSAGFFLVPELQRYVEKKINEAKTDVGKLSRARFRPIYAFQKIYEMFKERKLPKEVVLTYGDISRKFNKVSALLFSNATPYIGKLKANPYAHHSNRRLNTLIMSSSSALDFLSTVFLSYIPSSYTNLLGKKTDRKKFTLLEERNFSFYSESPVYALIDGQITGPLSGEIKVYVVPEAIKLFVPNKN